MLGEMSWEGGRKHNHWGGMGWDGGAALRHSEGQGLGRGCAMGNAGWEGTSLDPLLLPGLGFFPVLQSFYPFRAGTQRGDST